MKKILTVLGLVALLAGCASQNNGMGGTDEDSMNTSSSGVQFHNNAVNGTGTSMVRN